MSFDAGYLLASLLMSVVGFVLFRYGRKMRRLPHTLVGFVTMLFPYAFDTALPVLVVGAGLCALLWLATRFGL